jgi:hypothetical protein
MVAFLWVLDNQNSGDDSALAYVSSAFFDALGYASLTARYNTVSKKSRAVVGCVPRTKKFEKISVPTQLKGIRLLQENCLKVIALKLPENPPNPL